VIAEASAPCRVELGGGVPGGTTVAVAIDRRAWCRVETGIGGVELESKDALRKARALSLSEIPDGGPLGLVARVLRGLGVERGVRVVTQSRVPEGSGLGEEAALAVAVAGAAAAALGLGLGTEEIARAGRGPAAPFSGDEEVAARGGVSAVVTGAGGPGSERLAVDPGRIEESLLLIQCDAPLHAIGRPETPVVLSVAERVREALVRGRFEEVVGLWLEEWERRGARGPEEAVRIAGIVGGAGGAVRACGGRGGRVLAAWAPPGERGPGPKEAVLLAARGAGLRLFPGRVDLRGLDVE
jgi:hypothetical protein